MGSGFSPGILYTKQSAPVFRYGSESLSYPLSQKLFLATPQYCLHCNTSIGDDDNALNIVLMSTNRYQQAAKQLLWLFRYALIIAQAKVAF